MKIWFYTKLYLLVAAAKETIDLVSVKLSKMEEHYDTLLDDLESNTISNEKEVHYDC